MSSPLQSPLGQLLKLVIPFVDHQRWMFLEVVDIKSEVFFRENHLQWKSFCWIHRCSTIGQNLMHSQGSLPSLLKLDLHVLLLFTFFCSNQTHWSILDWPPPKCMFTVSINESEATCFDGRPRFESHEHHINERKVVTQEVIFKVIDSNVKNTEHRI